MMFTIIICGLGGVLAASCGAVILVETAYEKNPDWSDSICLAAIIFLVALFLSIGVPLIAFHKLSPKVREFGSWRLKEQGKQPTMQDPIVIEWQDCLYRCQLIEPKEAPNGK